MILAWLIIVLIAGGLAGWLLAPINARLPRWLALAALAVDAFLVLDFVVANAGQLSGSQTARWLVEFDRAWIPQLGIRFHLAMDGLSLLLVLLTLLLGIMAVACSWTEIGERVGFFHLNLLWVLAGILGVFLALDLFLFYFFWELMLVPMYFLIAIWGHENRNYAAMKFFLFTQLSGLLMLLAILALYFVHFKKTGTYSLDYTDLIGTVTSSTPDWAARLMMLGFLVAFAVKLPAIPVHTWLPDAHTEAPTAGSVVLAGLLLKTGAYGLLRFVVPLFPQAAADFATVAMILGVVGILYGALLAFGQTDMKRMVAYTSVSHMGFVLLGVFAGNELALQGAVIQILCHGLSTGALFIIVGAMQERMGTRDLGRIGGLWATVPRMGGVAMFFALASLGLPGLGNFVGEFLVLVGTYQRSIPLAAVASLGLIFSAIYSLWLMQAAFHGPNRAGWRLRDFSLREMAMMTPLMAALIWLGVNPQAVLNVSWSALKSLPPPPQALVAQKSELESQR